jgi:transposase-like protein
VPESAKAIGALAAEKFTKMIAFLKSPACRRVRTNNHVERVNRKLRYEEKARYKWRKRRTTVRFLVLLLDRYWWQERAVRNRWSEEPQPVVRNRSSPKTGAANRVA